MTSWKKSFDAVVVGSGPNGLSCAIVLAQAGLSVAVVEKSSRVGGGAKTEELTLPGFHHDVCSAVHPMGVASPFFRSLPLEDFGLKWIYSLVEAAHPLDGGRIVLLKRSVEETAKDLGKDRGAYSNIFSPLTKDNDLISEILLPPFHRPRSLFKFARFGLSAITSSQGFAKRFSGEEAQALWMGTAAHSAGSPAALGSSAPGLGLQVAGHGYGWPFPQGGSQSLSNALALFFKSKGGEIFNNVEVRKLDDLPEAKFIFFDLTPRQILKITENDLPANIKKSFGEFRYGPGVFKLDWALSTPIPWMNQECAKAATVHLGGTAEEIISWEENVSQGVIKGRPFVLLTQPSLFDSLRAPKGQHVAWGYCHVPSGSTQDLTDLVENQVERFAPGFKKTILARSRLSPQDLEKRNPNLIGGDISGGLVDLRQLFFRPRFALDPYAIDNKRFWICSSSTPPGPGVHGMCGYNAAMKALAKIL